MGSCIICGTSVDGRICELHQEDVVFEFSGSRPDQLTPGRYYRGSVDGFAEFGVFVDIGESVTGLLHKSELDRRLDSLDWDPGDTVFVQVQNVRDNGNVDLSWSIRQRESDFRGTLIDDPDRGTLLKEDDNDDGGGSDGARADDSAADSDTEADAESAGSADGGSADDGGATDGGAADGETGADAAALDDSAEASGGTAGGKTGAAVGAATEAGTVSEPAGEAELESESETEEEPETEEPTRVTVGELDEHVGDVVRLEGEIASARQTSGPTIFELRDETATVDCAAFEEAGVRAYPEVDEGDVVRLDGEVERRRGELQVETEALVVLTDADRDAVSERMETAMVQRAQPDAIEPLAADPAVEAVTDAARDVATAIRRAVFEGRPVVVRHSATADGYVAGVAIERATLPLVRAEHDDSDAEYHYFDRRPLEGSVYDMDDATGDVTDMLSNRERHGEKLPLFVFLAAGGTAESLDGLSLLDIYGARRAVVDERVVDDAVADAVETVVAPSLAAAETPETTATALSAAIAAGINPEVREELRHLPAVSFWEDAPAAYTDLAAEAGYDADATRELREAVALEAYYQSYEDKRELITDLLFPEEAGLAGHVSEQFRTKLGTAIDTAEANLDRHSVDGGTVLVLDTEAYTHRYEFPKTELLLDELYRRHRDEAAALLGLATDEAYVRTDADVDVRTVVDHAGEVAPDAGLDARGAREGRVEFLSGERGPVREALLTALGEAL